MGDNLQRRWRKKITVKKNKRKALESDTYSEEPEGGGDADAERRWRSNSNYPRMAIRPDIFRCSQRTICLKIPNVVAVQMARRAGNLFKLIS